MKRLIKQGYYKLLETKKNTKVILLSDGGIFAWVDSPRIGEILIRFRKKFTLQNVLAIGKYRLFDIKNEPKLVDLQHLELEIGLRRWQGYLLPRGLPTTKDKKHRIIPTNELVPSRTGKNILFDEMLEKIKFLPNQTVAIA